MVEKPEDYEWSSYKAFVGPDYKSWLDTERILNYFIGDNKASLYSAFVQDARDTLREDKEIEDHCADEAIVEET